MAPPRVTTLTRKRRYCLRAKRDRIGYVATGHFHNDQLLSITPSRDELASPIAARADQALGNDSDVSIRRGALCGRCEIDGASLGIETAQQKAGRVAR